MYKDIYDELMGLLTDISNDDYDKFSYADKQEKYKLYII